MFRDIVGAWVFLVLAVVHAIASELIRRRFGDRAPLTWYRFFDRWGLTLIFLIAAAAEFVEAGSLSVPMEALYAAMGVLIPLIIAANVVRVREVQREAEKYRDS